MTAASAKQFQDSGFWQVRRVKLNEVQLNPARPCEKSAGMKFFVNNKKRNGVQRF